MPYILLRDKIEYSCAYQFADNWAQVCKDKGYNMSALLRTINKRKDYVYQIKQGNYSATLNLYTLQLLSDLVSMSIVDVLNYKPKSGTATHSKRATIPAK